MQTTNQNEMHSGLIDIDQISESTFNNRGPITDDSVKELAADMNVHGLINPITVRNFQKSGKHFFQVIAGSRRLRAAKLLNWTKIPATVRDCNDDEAFEIMVIENLQRENVHPMDEAIAFATLVAKSDIKAVSSRIGKDVQYITRRIKLNDLVNDAVSLFRAGELEIGHCVELCRLTPGDQKRAIDWMKTSSSTYDPKSGGSFVTKYIRPVKALEHYIKTEIIRSLNAVPFDLNDDKLHVKAGSCTTCSKRSGANAMLFPDIKKADQCFDGACLKIKIDNFLNHAIKALNDDGVDVIGLSSEYYFDAKKNPFKQLRELLASPQYHEIKGKDQDGETGIFIDGPRIGEVVRFKRAQTKSEKVDKKSLPLKIQVNELNEKKNRGIELDRKKVFESVVGLISENPAFRSSALPAKEIGIGLPVTVLMIYCIIDKWNRAEYDDVKKLIGVDIYESIDSKKLADKIFAFSKDSKRWNHFVRLFVFSELKSRNVERNPFIHDMMIQVARYHMIDIEPIITEQSRIRKDRETRIDKRLNELTTKKPAGKKTDAAKKEKAKPTTKKPAGKKTAKKPKQG